MYLRLIPLLTFSLPSELESFETFFMYTSDPPASHEINKKNPTGFQNGSQIFLMHAVSKQDSDG